MRSHLPLVLWALSIMQVEVNKATLRVIRWNKRLEKFEPIPGLPTYDVYTESHTWQIRKKENHNFNGQPLHLTYFQGFTTLAKITTDFIQEFGFVHFYDNNTRVTGIYGDMWTTLAEMLNFTLVVKKSEVNSLGGSFDNGSYSGILEDARLNRTDIIPKLEVLSERVDAVRFTPSFWLNCYRIYAYGQWQRNRAWMFTQFSVHVWCMVLITILILSIGSLTMQKVLLSYKGPIVRKEFIDHIFDTFATICNQGNILEAPSNGAKILTVTISIFSWLILVAFGAHLISNMAHEVFEAPFTDIKSLYENTDFNIVVRNGSLNHLRFTHAEDDSIQERILRAKRLTVVSDLAEVNKKVCSNFEKYVLLDGEDEVRGRNTRGCTLLPANKARFYVPIASGVSKNVKNKNSIDYGILKLCEFGITAAIKNRYFSLEEKKANVRQTDSLAISLKQLSLTMLVLAVGVVASIVICVAENIFFALQKREITRRLNQELPEIKQPLFATHSTNTSAKSIYANKKSRSFYSMGRYNYLRGRSRISSSRNQLETRQSTGRIQSNMNSHPIRQP